MHYIRERSHLIGVNTTLFNIKFSLKKNLISQLRDSNCSVSVGLVWGLLFLFSVCVSLIWFPGGVIRWLGVTRCSSCSSRTCFEWCNQALSTLTLKGTTFLCQVVIGNLVEVRQPLLAVSVSTIH